MRELEAIYLEFPQLCTPSFAASTIPAIKLNTAVTASAITANVARDSSMNDVRAPKMRVSHDSTATNMQ